MSSESQPDLFTPTAEPAAGKLTVMHKNIASTSVEAFSKQLKNIPKRWLRILKRIADYADYSKSTFTAQELIKSLAETDVNNVRPELTRMKSAELLRNGKKRSCTITSQTVFTWEITELGREHLKRFRSEGK